MNLFLSNFQASKGDYEFTAYHEWLALLDLLVAAVGTTRVGFRAELFFTGVFAVSCPLEKSAEGWELVIAELNIPVFVQTKLTSDSALVLKEIYSTLKLAEQM